MQVVVFAGRTSACWKGLKRMTNCAAHPAVQGNGSLAVRPSKLLIGFNHKGAFPPGMCAQEVQKAQEAA